MRIAVIAPPWVPVPPPRYGGSEGVIDLLARGFYGAGHDVLLFTTADSTCPVPKAWALERAEGERIGETMIELQHAVRAYERVTGFDIINDHTVAGPLLAPPGTPVVTTNHGPFTGSSGEVYRAISRRASVVAISHNQASTAVDTAIARVIHHGVDVDNIRVGDGNGGFALFLGRMSPDKGVHLAARAARQAGMPLRIAAKVRERAEHDYFVDVVKPLLGGDIEYIGEVDWRTKFELLASATCLLNPITWAEPFGLVMVEALACGTPVIAGPIGAATEIIDEGVTGYLRSDEDALVNVLGKVHELDRAACRAVAVARFSARRMVSEHLELFEDLLSGRVDAVRGGYG